MEGHAADLHHHGAGGGGIVELQGLAGADISTEERLAIAEASDVFDLPRMESTAHAAGIDTDTVNSALLAATAWTSEVTEHWE